MGKTRQIRDAAVEEKPSDVVRESNIYFSLESGESQLAAAIEYLGPDHFVYASDVPHWDTEFPENLAQLRNHPDLSEEVKENSSQECKDVVWSGLDRFIGEKKAIRVWPAIRVRALLGIRPRHPNPSPPPGTALTIAHT